MSDARPLVVFGAGGHGKVVADVGRTAGFELAAFVDDGAGRDGGRFFGAPVYSWARLLASREQLGELVVALAVGNNAVRERCHARVVEAGLAVATLVHARAVVASSARIGAGTVIMAGAVVNPDAEVGRGVILNTGCVVEHDCVVCDWVHLSPNAALGGGVRIGERTHVGLGAVALPGVRIGADVRVGAGGVVNREVLDGLTVVGVPARPMSPREQG